MQTWTTKGIPLDMTCDSSESIAPNKSKDTAQNVISTLNEALAALAPSALFDYASCDTAIHTTRSFIDTFSAEFAESSWRYPLRRLNALAAVTTAPCRKIIARDRKARFGAYSYHTIGFDYENIDDYTLDGRYLLVGRLGVVFTSSRHLLVVSCEGKSTPSELFTVVIPNSLADYDYLYEVLRSTMAPPFLQGNNLVQEITPSRLSAAIIPWPDTACRYAFIETMKSLDSLSSQAVDRRNPSDVERFKLVDAVRIALGALYLQGTHHVEMLVGKKQTCATDNHPEGLVHDLPPLETQSANTVSSDARDNMTLPINESSIDAPLFNTDESVLDLIAGVVDLVSIPSDGDPDILDVVAQTKDLEHTATSHKARTCVCMPAPNQDDWTTAAIDPTDPRWILGVPPRNKANFAWIMQTVASLDQGGTGILLICNSPLVSSVGREFELRRNLATSGLVECVIGLPGAIFRDRRPPSSVVILHKSPDNRSGTFVNSKAESKTLFINLQEYGLTIGDPLRDVIARFLPAPAIERALRALGSWLTTGDYHDQPGFCMEVTRGEITKKDFILAPWAYV